jgi:hypothetical protein
MRCDLCQLPDPYYGLGDGYASCDCLTPRDGEDGALTEDDRLDDPEIATVRPGEPPTKVHTIHLPGDTDA